MTFWSHVDCRNKVITKSADHQIKCSQKLEFGNLNEISQKFKLLLTNLFRNLKCFFIHLICWSLRLLITKIRWSAVHQMSWWTKQLITKSADLQNRWPLNQLFSKTADHQTSWSLNELIAKSVDYQNSWSLKGVTFIILEF